MLLSIWRVARYTSGEAVASRLPIRRQTTLETPPQSLIRLTLASGGRHDAEAEGNHDASLLWIVARYTSGEAARSRLVMGRQSIVEAPPQSSRLTLRKRRET